MFTYDYVAPDVLYPIDDSKFTRQELCSDDIYSLMVSVVYLLFDKYPFSDFEKLPNQFKTAKFDINSFYQSIPDQKLTSEFQVLEDLIVGGLETNRKSRLKVNDLFLKLNPGVQMPPINLTELHLKHETRQFITQILNVDLLTHVKESAV